MATSELAAKLARRNQLNEAGGAETSFTNSLEPKESIAMAPTSELAAKLARRNQLNESGSVVDLSSNPMADSTTTSEKGITRNPLAAVPQSSELAAKLAKRISVTDITSEVGGSTQENDIPSSQTEAPPLCRTNSEKLALSTQSKELADKLQRRNQINDGTLVGSQRVIEKEQFIYRDFPEFSTTQVMDLQGRFTAIDTDKDGGIRLDDLKKLLENLGEPQTHFTLRNVLKEFNIDKENDISFRDFLKVLRRLKIGKMDDFSSMIQQQSIEVHEVGVSGAKSFFEAKQKQVLHSSAVDAQLRANQEAMRKAREEEEARKKQFKERIANFSK